MIIKFLKYAVLFSVIITCISCASVNHYINQAQQVARHNNLEKRIIEAGFFSLVTYSKLSDENDVVHVYIEGDGYAFTPNRYPSNNPTPHNPMALKLASIDPHPNILYIARPFQFVESSQPIKKIQKYWTSHRFAPEVINSIHDALNQFVRGNQGIKLFGFSGGGAMAALVASQRDDVTCLVTVAGNLDHRKHSEIHQVEYLEESLNAIDYVDQLQNIKQIHFVGQNDKVVPLDVALSYQQAIGLSKDCVVVVSATAHHKGWVRVWPKLLNSVFGLE